MRCLLPQRGNRDYRRALSTLLVENYRDDNRIAILARTFRPLEVIDYAFAAADDAPMIFADTSLPRRGQAGARRHRHISRAQRRRSLARKLDATQHGRF